MLSPQDDRATAAVQESLHALGRPQEPSPVPAAGPRRASDRFRRTSDRAFLGLVAELARSDRKA